MTAPQRLWGWRTATQPNPPPLEAEDADEPDLGKLLAEHEADERLPPSSGFVISVTRGGNCLRLHYVGFCYRVPGEHYKCFRAHGEKEPHAGLFNFRCRDCFPAGRAEKRAAEADAEISESDGTVSSGSSGASEEAVEEDDGE